MTNTNYTPLHLSKLIAERLPKLATRAEKYLYIPCGHEEDAVVLQKDEDYLGDSHQGKYVGDCVDARVSCYNFTDCLWAIEMLGEKEGWEAYEIVAAYNDYSLRNDPDTDCCIDMSQVAQNGSVFLHKHCLLDAFIADRDTIGENTIAYLTELFTKK